VDEHQRFAGVLRAALMATWLSRVLSFARLRRPTSRPSSASAGARLSPPTPTS